MVVIPLAKPYSLKAATFSIVDDDFTAALSRVEFTPTTSSTTWRGIGGNTLKDQTIAEWTATLGFAQDLAPEGLMRYLHEHEGEYKACSFIPLEDGPTITAELSISPAKIGGQSDGSTVTGEVTLGLRGKPAFLDAPEP